MRIISAVMFFLLLSPFNLHAGVRQDTTRQDIIDLAIEVYNLQPALFQAADQGKINDVKALLDKGESTEGRGLSGLTPLMVASKNGHLEIVRLLLDANANVEAIDEEGNTSLMYAVRHPRIVNVLLANFSLIRNENSYGSTALELAMQGKYSESIVLLEEAEAAEAEWQQLSEELWDAFAQPSEMTVPNELSFIMLDGTEIIYSTNLKGKKPLYLYFWATWEPKSRQQIQALSDIEKELGDRMQVIAVSVGEERNEVLQLIDQHDLILTIALDEDFTVAKLFEVSELPTSVVIDKNGVVVCMKQEPKTSLSSFDPVPACMYTLTDEFLR